MTVSVVTGGSSGIGAAIVERLARRGDTVIVFDLLADPPCDVTDPAAVRAAADRAVAEHGPVDVIVNCAGAYPDVPFDELGVEEWDHIQSLVLRGPYLVCSAFEATISDGGSICSIASTITVDAPATMAHYTAAKSGLVGLTRSMARHFGPRGVRVNCVSPGVVATGTWVAMKGEPLLDEIVSSQILDDRAVTPAEVAAAVDFLTGPDSVMITGQNLHVDGGATFH